MVPNICPYYLLEYYLFRWLLWIVASTSIPLYIIDTITWKLIRWDCRWWCLCSVVGGPPMFWIFRPYMNEFWWIIANVPLILPKLSRWRKKKRYFHSTEPTNGYGAASYRRRPNRQRSWPCSLHRPRPSTARRRHRSPESHGVGDRKKKSWHRGRERAAAACTEPSRRSRGRTVTPPALHGDSPQRLPCPVSLFASAIKPAPDPFRSAYSTPLHSPLHARLALRFFPSNRGGGNPPVDAAEGPRAQPPLPRLLPIPPRRRRRLNHTPFFFP